MDRLGIIYKATSPSGKVYIGQTTKGLEVRKNLHYRITTKYDHKFARALNKYKYQIKWDILYNNVPINKLNLAEKCAIYLYDSYYKGYNSTLGGKATTGLIQTQKARNKISRAQIGRKHSEKTKIKMSKAQIGHPFYGNRTASAETKKKMSDARMGRPLSAETKLKLSKARMGKPGTKHTERTKEILSVINSAEKNPMAKLSWTIVSEIRLKYKSNNYSQAELARLFNVSNMTINKIVHNKSWKI